MLGSLMFFIGSFDDNKLEIQVPKNLSCLKLSGTLLMNDDTLLEFRRTCRFLTGAGVHDPFVTISLSFKFHKDRMSRS